MSLSPVSRLAIAAGAVGSLAAAAQAQFVRPDSATATSVFSGSYVANNAINGSGLPAGFGPGSAHASYVAGNHWTTASGQTIGQSATFSFASPRSIGAFHLWNHRSDSIANNPNYAVVLYDLIFRDSGGATLAQFTGVTAQPNVATAQTYSLPRVANVSSVQFIVRATAAGNVSPFTGLAEVAFDACLAVGTPTRTTVTACRTSTLSIEAPSSTIGSASVQWRRGGVPLVDGVNASGVVAAGVNTPTLTLSQLTFDDPMTYDVVVTNACTTVISAPVALSYCYANCDCSTSAPVLNALDFSCFLGRFGAALTIPAPQQASDYANCDGSTIVPVLNALDFSCFLQRYRAGCP